MSTTGKVGLRQQDWNSELQGVSNAYAVLEPEKYSIETKTKRLDVIVERNTRLVGLVNRYKAVLEFDLQKMAGVGANVRAVDFELAEMMRGT